jgi:hypothetical protein
MKQTMYSLRYALILLALALALKTLSRYLSKHFRLHRSYSASLRQNLLIPIYLTRLFSCLEHLKAFMWKLSRNRRYTQKKSQSIYSLMPTKRHLW